MFDGAAFGKEMVGIVKLHVERATAPLLTRIDALERQLANQPHPRDGKDADMVVILSRIETEVEKACTSAINASRPAIIDEIDVRVARAVAAIPAPKDGESVDPADIERMIAAEVARLPKPQDGKSIGIEDVRPLIEEAVSKAVAAIPPAEPGKSITADDVKPLIADLVSKTVATLPPPKNGEPGKNADPVETERMVSVAVAKAVAEIHLPELPDIPALIDKAVAGLPKPENGKDVDPADVQAMVDKAVSALPPPKPGEPGKSVSLEDIAPMVRQAAAKAAAEAVKTIPLPKEPLGYAKALIGRGGTLVFTRTDGSTESVGQVVGRDADMGALREELKVMMEAIPKPRDGADGLGFDDLEVLHDGEREIMLRMTRGERVKEFAFTLPVQIYRGVYVDGKDYARGDTVTWAGSLWHCDDDTNEKPGDGSKAWRLAVKRGRDGKEPVSLK